MKNVNAQLVDINTKNAEIESQLETLNMWFNTEVDV